MAAELFDWFEARRRAVAGKRVRLFSDTQHWFHIHRGLWWIETIGAAKKVTITSGSTTTEEVLPGGNTIRLVQVNDWSEGHFRSQEWTTVAPGEENIPNAPGTIPTDDTGGLEAPEEDDKPKSDVEPTVGGKTPGGDGGGGGSGGGGGNGDDDEGPGGWGDNNDGGSMPAGGGGGGGDGGGGDPDPPGPGPGPGPGPDPWKPADFDVQVEPVCDGVTPKLAVTVTASNVAENDTYMVTLHYADQDRPGGVITTSGDSVSADFDATTDSPGHIHTVIVSITNTGIKYGWKTTQNGTAEFPNVCSACSVDQSASGGDGGFDQTYPLPEPPEGKELRLNWSFEAFTIKDRFRLFAESGGTNLVDTGCVSSDHNGNVAVPAGTTAVRIVVTPHCDGDTGTAWNFSIICELVDLPAP